ncbi:MAG TPA: hypothetical protein VLE73_02480 [Candidatus Saccharimonadales bacterium]|nr:hypothetical protein [Candidatus Saccharimonadales bacterium]
MIEIGPLAGVHLLHSPDTLQQIDLLPQYAPDSSTRPRIEHFDTAERHTMELARSLGATIVEVDEGEPHPTGAAVYWQVRAYPAAHAATQRLIGGIRDQLPDIWRQNVAELTDTSLEAASMQLAAGTPMMLAYTPLDNGHIKYLLEADDQLERFLSFAAHAGQRIDLCDFELREFVETPSEHYTSFRTVADATGAVLAAGVHYSRHKKTEPRRVVTMDRFSDSPSESRVRYIKNALENPTSKYYLGARDVRSNSACGGAIIALMGTDPKPPNKEEVAILEAHEIDPAFIQPPTAPLKMAQLIGSTVGPQTHLVLGIDSIGTRYGETNFGPGGGVYAACHMRGGGTTPERYIAMREHALANIARKHNPPAL